MGTHQTRRMFSPHKNKSTPVSCGPEIFYGAKRRTQEWWSFVLGTLILKREKSFLLALKFIHISIFWCRKLYWSFKVNNIMFVDSYFELLFLKFILNIIFRLFYQWLLSFNYDINKSLFTKRSEIVSSYLYPRHMTKKHSVL